MRSPAGASAGPSLYPREHDARGDRVTRRPTDPRELAAAPDDEPQHERHIASTIFNIVMLVVGGVALWWILRTLSWEELRATLIGVGAWAAVILTLDLISMCMDAAALHAFMRPEARMISYWRVLGAQASGRAINVLTPGGALGEATKLSLLVSHAPRSRVLSSIVLFNLTNIYLSVTVMLIGTPITLLMLDLPRPVKILVAVGLVIIIPAMIALAVIVHRGAVATIVGAIRRLRIISPERAASWKDKLKDVDRHIRELHTHRSAGTWKGLIWVGVSKLVFWSSTMLLIYQIGIPLSPVLIIGVLSVGVIVAWSSMIVPMGVGLLEAGNYAMFGLLGATSEQGLLVAMLNRGRTIAAAFVGLGAMAVLQIANRLAMSRIQRKLQQLRDRAAAQP